MGKAPEFRICCVEKILTANISIALCGKLRYSFDCAPVNRVAYRLPLDDLSSDSSSSVIRVSGTDYQVLAQRSRYTGWRTLGVFSLAEMLREVLLIRSWTYVIGGITMILAIVAAYFFTSSIAKPVLNLRSLMKRVEHGDLAVRFSGAPNDEIGELGLGFNEMIERIQSLIDQVYSEQQSKREAELRILQEQIKPHFLYNTLDTIQWMAQEHRVDDVVGMVGALTSLFRIGLNKGREFIALSEEIEHVESYLRIQKMRYEDKFDYAIDCGCSLKPRRVLRLMLQPLVENAIYHGIKERRGHGSLVVAARIESGDLFLSVKDDGVGMSEAMLEKLNASLEDGGPSVGGYGIRNVHERIRLTYGKPYGLSYESAFGEGTKVTIRHPLSSRRIEHVEGIDRRRRAQDTPRSQDVIGPLRKRLGGGGGGRGRRDGLRPSPGPEARYPFHRYPDAVRNGLDLIGGLNMAFPGRSSLSSAGTTNSITRNRPSSCTYSTMSSSRSTPKALCRRSGGPRPSSSRVAARASTARGRASSSSATCLSFVNASSRTGSAVRCPGRSFSRSFPSCGSSWLRLRLSSPLDSPKGWAPAAYRREKGKRLVQVAMRTVIKRRSRWEMPTSSRTIWRPCSPRAPLRSGRADRHRLGYRAARADQVTQVPSIATRIVPEPLEGMCDAYEELCAELADGGNCEAFVVLARNYIDKHYWNPALCLEDAAAELQISPATCPA